MVRESILAAFGVALLAAPLGACSNSSGSGGGAGYATTTTYSTTTTHSGSGGTGHGGTGTGGMGAMGGGGVGGQGGGQGGAGGGAASVNGCTLADATDMTAHNVVDLTWSNPHHECTLIHAGATVTWTGDFAVHPLVGGITPTEDASSPITTTGPVGNAKSVVFSQAGDYPYFCTVHLTAMQGVIYVQ
jgi:plastocyanin